MTSMIITLSDGLETWIGKRLQDGSYTSADEYVADLVRRDRAQAEEVRRIKALVEEGLASGVVDAEPEDVLKEIMAQLPDE